MAGFTHMSTIVGNGLQHMRDITDLDVMVTADGVYLYSASHQDGGINSFRLSANSTAVFSDAIAATGATGTMGLVSIDVHMVAGQMVLIPSGRFAAGVVLHEIDATGSFTNLFSPPLPTSSISQFTHTITVDVGGKSFMFASQYGQSKLRSFRLNDDLSLTRKSVYADNNNRSLGDISDFATVTTKKGTYLFAASSMDAGLTSFKVEKWGGLKQKDVVKPADDTGFSNPTVLDVAHVGKRAFLLMGAAGSDTITVYRIGNNGRLKEVDSVMDDLDSRFQNVSVIDSFSYGGRTFIIAGGSDGGLTLFELDHRGKLFEITSITDQLDTTLDSVSALNVVVIGDDIQVFVSSSTEDGITQFDLDLGNLGDVIKGGRTADTLVGTAADDLIYGMGRADNLSGGDGDDRLFDGRGRDKMTGGAGADVFVFEQDGRTDTITDFTLGKDRIDLSDFDNLHYYGDLKIKPRSFGAIIKVDGEKIRVFSDDGAALHMSDFSQHDFIF